MIADGDRWVEGWLAIDRALRQRVANGNQRRESPSVAGSGPGPDRLAAVEAQPRYATIRSSSEVAERRVSSPTDSSLPILSKSVPVASVDDTV